MEGELAAAIATVPTKVLVKIVKFAQSLEKKGDSGGWKEFLKTYDKNIGASLSDPARRTRETLAAFLLSFTEKEDRKFLDNLFRSYFNYAVLKELMKESSDNESPQQDLVVTKLPKISTLMKSSEMIAIDCEMVLCEDGTDAVVRVCVVDHNLQCWLSGKLDEKVNPFKPVADYRTKITGITAADLDGVSYSLADIQKSMKKLLKKGTILVGNGLHHDLKALKLDHARVIDTSFIFCCFNGQPTSLGGSCKLVLGYELRNKGASHNCVDDACAAMRLVLVKIERLVDNDYLLNQEEVLENEKVKLLIHGIPIDVPGKELLRVFSEKCALELKPPKKAKGAQYSALSIFRNPQVAQRAFENLKGKFKKDKHGFQQKIVKLDLNTGTVSLYVRKMGHDLYEPKEPKADECADHLKKIERLREKLKEKDAIHLSEIEQLEDYFGAKICEWDKIISFLWKELAEMKMKRKNK